jgi:hypothetical protein
MLAALRTLNTKKNAKVSCDSQLQKGLHVAYYHKLRKI